MVASLRVKDTHNHEKPLEVHLTGIAKQGDEPPVVAAINELPDGATLEIVFGRKGSDKKFSLDAYPGFSDERTGTLAQELIAEVKELPVSGEEKRQALMLLAAHSAKVAVSWAGHSNMPTFLGRAAEYNQAALQMEKELEAGRS